MHLRNIESWKHSHVFGHDQVRSGERKTVLAVWLTALFMVAEIVAGLAFGSMALLADGLHMASHATALGINLFAYRYARRFAHDTSFTFGTGKVNALGGFSGALLLGIFALFMAFESFKRLLAPVHIVYDAALLVAVLGLAVNIVSVLILKDEDPDHGHHDHNLRSAYLHVLADAMTSLLAIAALLVAKHWGFVWADPLMGILGAMVVTRWAWGLVKETTHVLLDKAAPEPISRGIREAIERDGDSRIADLHVWVVGPGLYSVIVSVVACRPKTAQEYKRIVSADGRLVHVTVEVLKYDHCD
jgi:cation diffusion facilitator family transporter